MLRILWEAWKVVARKIGDLQARVIMALIYFGLVGPIALLRRLGADPLGLRRKPRATYWHQRPPAAESLDVAGRQ